MSGPSTSTLRRRRDENVGKERKRALQRGRDVHVRELPGKAAENRPPFAGCRNPKSRHEREPPSAPLEAGAASWWDGPRPASDEGADGAYGAGSIDDEEGRVRGLLLSPQPPVCARARRALHDVSSRQPGGAAPAPAAALQLPPGAPHAGGVGVPQRAGAGGAARILIPRRAAPP